MLTFSKSEVDKFQHTKPELRYGQQFHQYFKLGKVINADDRHWCDVLYNASNEHAKAMIRNRIDQTQ